MISAFGFALALSLASEVAARPPGVADFGEVDVDGAVFVGASIDFSLAIPARGATMPKNARLLVFGQFFDEQSQPVEQDVRFERVLDDGQRLALTDSEALGTSLNGRAYFVELGDLVVGETITVTCDLCFDEWSATVVDAVDEEAPVFRAGNKSRLAVTDMGEGVGYQVRACIPMPIDAAGGAVALRVITDVRDGYAPALQGGGIGGCALDEVEVAAFADGDARTFCFQALAVDGAGNESLFHENICAELPPHAPPQGCAQTSGAPMLAALALLLSRAGQTSRRRARA